MTVVAFQRSASLAQGAWRADELQQLVASVVAPARAHGEDVSWDIGTTEHGDPQFYLLGPAPHFECLLCCSRVEARYIVENGAGGLLGMEVSLRQAIGAASRALARKRSALAARLLVLFVTLRITVAQKLDPVMEETSDWLVRLEPQLAAFV
jgi:hypothetical protein